MLMLLLFVTCRLWHASMPNEDSAMVWSNSFQWSFSGATKRILNSILRQASCNCCYHIETSPIMQLLLPVEIQIFDGKSKSKSSVLICDHFKEDIRCFKWIRNLSMLQNIIMERYCTPTIVHHTFNENCGAHIAGMLLSQIWLSTKHSTLFHKISFNNNESPQKFGIALELPKPIAMKAKMALACWVTQFIAMKAPNMSALALR